MATHSPTHLLEFETKLYGSITEIFEFFSRAENLNKVTPPDVSFTILTPSPIPTKVGTLIDYRETDIGWCDFIEVFSTAEKFKNFGE